MDTNEALSVICSLVESIEKLYNSVSDEWVQYAKEKNVYCFNQKSTKVIDFKTNDKMSDSFRKYIEFLSHNKKISSLKEEIKNEFVSSRIKSINSVVEKIDEYQCFRKEKGEVPVNKCLNDLFGVRLIIDCDELCTNLIKKTLDEKYSDEILIVDKNHKDVSSELFYKATHIYFKRIGNNYSYRWELQIWRLCDEKTNLESHERHRYKYTKWERVKNDNAPHYTEQ